MVDNFTSERQINLRLPCSDPIGLQKNPFETPDTYKKQPTEVSENRDKNSSSTSDRRPASQIRSLESANILKDTIRKTSEKLKTYTSSTSILKYKYNNNSIPEIEKLKINIKMLELEKNQLININNELNKTIKNLNENIKQLVEPSETQVEVSKILKYAVVFASSVKNDLSMEKLFLDIFQSEKKFIYEIKKENFSKTCLNLFEFIQETLLPNRNTSSGIKTKSSSEELPDIIVTPPMKSFTLGCEIGMGKISNQTDLLSQVISAQKQKIMKTYESLKESVNGSRNMLESSAIYSKNPFSLTSNTEIEEKRDLYQGKKSF